MHIGILILLSVSLYQYRYWLEKYHIGIGIDNYNIQISVSVLVKSIKAFVEKLLFFVAKVSISFRFSYQTWRVSCNASVNDWGRIWVVRKCHRFFSSGVQLYCFKTSFAIPYDQVSILFIGRYIFTQRRLFLVLI